MNEIANRFRAEGISEDIIIKCMNPVQSESLTSEPE